MTTLFATAGQYTRALDIACDFIAHNGFDIHRHRIRTAILEAMPELKDLPPDELSDLLYEASEEAFLVLEEAARQEAL